MSASPVSSNPPATPLFAARCIDKPGFAAVRETNRPAHLAWAEATPSFVFGARLMEPVEYSDVQQQYNNKTEQQARSNSPVGSLIIFRADDQTVVTNALETDPYKQAGLWDVVEVRQWLRTMQNAPDPLHLIQARLFCIWCVDKIGKKHLRAETRPEHIAWWKSAGKIGMIGPFPAADGNGADGTMIVIEGEDLKQVQEWAATDPYAIAGLFEKVHIYPLSVTADRI